MLNILRASEATAAVAQDAACPADLVDFAGPAIRAIRTDDEGGGVEEDGLRDGALFGSNYAEGTSLAGRISRVVWGLLRGQR